MRRRLLVLAAATALSCALAATAFAATVSVPAKFHSIIKSVERKSQVAVLLPSTLSVDVSGSRVFGTGKATTKGYDLELGIGHHCNGAEACFVASFFARNGAKPALRRKVKLARHIAGFYKGISCGASCSPGEIQWVEHGVLYDIQYKGVQAGHEKSGLRAIANSAIKAGKRR